MNISSSMKVSAAGSHLCMPSPSATSGESVYSLHHWALHVISGVLASPFWFCNSAPLFEKAAYLLLSPEAEVQLQPAYQIALAISSISQLVLKGEDPTSLSPGPKKPS